MSIGRWYWYAFCPCGEAFGKNHLYEICPTCAADKSTFTLSIARWRGTAVWWKPWTWESGYYERHDNYERGRSL